MRHENTSRSRSNGQRNTRVSKKVTSQGAKNSSIRSIARPVMGAGETRPSTTKRCVDCKEAIPGQRLKAQPNATRCLNCQSKVDQKYIAGDYKGRSLEDVDATDFAIVRQPYQPIPEVANTRIIHPQKVEME